MTPSNDARTNLRVAHVVLSMDVGGLERVVLDLVRQGQLLGQQVAVVCVEQPGQLALQLQRLGVTVRCAWKPLGLKWGTVTTVG
ncbi:MAG TPA: hypothetical protein VFA18_22115, partial [Gemmataceae bacterium]|nr:hypothetical protein [Gemmataceae bacterium]